MPRNEETPRVAGGFCVRDAGSLNGTEVVAKAVHIVTHDRQTFYNVCQHPFLDRDDGRVIHFEGTYTRDFSGNPERTPRYDYNQVLYRLDLGGDWTKVMGP